MTPSPIRSTLTVGFIGTAAAAAIALSAHSLAQPQRAQPAATKPLLTWSGAISQVRKGLEITRITDAETWTRTWERHMGDKIEKSSLGRNLSPQIDFDRCMVVAIFRGKDVNSDGEFIVSIDERPGDLLIRFDSTTYQSSSNGGGPDPGENVTPYGIFLLPHSTRPIVVEENVQDLIGAPPIWKEQARFPALDAKQQK